MRRRFAPVVICALAVAMLGGAGRDAPVRVVDGDSLDIGGVSMRLIGIDAPELGQSCGQTDGRAWPCGQAAKAALEALVLAGGGVRCTGSDHDRYGRLLVNCTARTGDVGRAMVRQGMAWAYRKYATVYVADEELARASGAGIWQGRALAPEAFRASQIASRSASQSWAIVVEAAVASPATCQIKGNISDNGRIYHLPGQPFYDKTRIATARGERWFCSEPEALAAGWRKAR